MKKKFLCIAVFYSIFLNAQSVIVDEKFDKDYVPIGYNVSLVSNKIFIEKGKHSVGMSRNKQVNSITSYDSKALKTNICNFISKVFF